MRTDDRVALILGRAIIRAEALEAALAEAQARIAELEVRGADEPDREEVKRDS